MVSESTERTEQPQVAEDFYEQLVACLPHLRAFARVLCRQQDMVDDLVQDAVTRALAAARQFQAGTNFKAWMFTILRNQNITTFRRRRNYPISLEETTHEVVQSPSQEFSLMMQDLDQAVKRLSPQRREALMLVIVHGLSYEEAASVCGCAVGTIKSRVARARAELQVSVMGEESVGSSSQKAQDGVTRRAVSGGSSEIRGAGCRARASSGHVSEMDYLPPM